MNFLIYWIGTGRVERVIFAPSSEYAELQLVPGQGFVQGTGDDTTHYVLNGAVTLRPEMPVSQFGNALNVPPGTEFSVRGPASMDGVATDGTLEFEFAEPGTYTVTLRKFPFLDREVTLEG